MALPKIVVEPKWHSRTSRKYMMEGELEVLLTLVDSVSPRSMIEIGVNEGLTASAVLANVNSIERYVGIDVTPDYRFEIPAQQIERPEQPGRLVKDDPRFELMLRSQSGTCNIDGGFDVVFIDGDHGYSAVLGDYALAKKLIQPGGIIIAHDYQNPTVQATEALDHLRAEGRDLFHVDGTWLAVERR